MTALTAATEARLPSSNWDEVVLDKNTDQSTAFTDSDLTVHVTLKCDLLGRLPRAECVEHGALAGVRGEVAA